MLQIKDTIAKGPFNPAWDSLVNYKIPQWYEDAKFGIFIHWGLYSVPAFGNEWYPHFMYQEGTPEFKHHLATYGPHNKFGYKDFIPMFKAKKYDPAHWAALFRKSGARFVMPVAEHHDGFPMYDCGFTNWSAAKMGPKRDIIGALAEAVRQEGMIFGLSSHRAEHWWFFEGGMKFDSDVRDPRYFDFYGPARPVKDGVHHLHRKSLPMPDAAYLEDWLNRTCELVDKYKPQIVWFDWWIQHVAFDRHLQQFAAYYYNRGAEWNTGVAINYKHDAFPEGSAVFDVERGQLVDIRPIFWQTDTSVAKTAWGYIQNHEYKTSAQIIGDLVDIVSKNGAMLLNIGPKPDGTIPEPEERILLEIGDWLNVNGEAIYDTRPWKIFGEGPTQIVEGSFNDTKRSDFTAEDIRFTCKGEVLYAIALGWPADGSVRIKTLASNSPHAREISAISLLGSGCSLKWTRDANGLTIHLPEQRPCINAFVFKIK